jgi:hypothetical protein
MPLDYQTSEKITAIVLDSDPSGRANLKPNTNGLGYASGGGTVTQTVSASTGVELNKLCGQITTVALTTAANAEEVFTVTNSFVDASDVVVASTTYAGAGTIQISTKKVVDGAFDLVIANHHASNALNAAVTVNFVVIKSVTA